MLKNSIIFCVIFSAVTAFSQKENRNSAIADLKDARSLIESQEFAKGKEKLLAAAKSIELAAANSETKNEFRTLKAMGDIYLDLHAAYSRIYLKTEAYGVALKSKGGFERALKATSNKNELSELDDQMKILQNNVYHQGVEAYSSGIYQDAHRSFVLAQDLADLRGDVVASRIYATGMSCEMVRDYTAAFAYYERCVELNYSDVNLYTSMLNCAFLSGNEEGMAKTIVAGEAKFPNDQTFLVAVANAHLMNGNHAEAAVTLEKAILNEPRNKSHHYVLGAIYEQLKMVRKAEECYMEALKIDPNYFEANYNLGAVYFNEGLSIQRTLIMSDMGDPNVPKIENEVKQNFKSALIFLVKAHEVNPTDYSTISSLLSIYMHLEMNDEYQDLKSKFQKLKEGN